MNKIRIAKNKPNYLPNENNYPSFQGYQITESVREIADIYIAHLFDGGVTINGDVQNYQSLTAINVFISITTNDLNYDKVFNCGYLEITISNQKYYYFVNSANWINENILSLDLTLDFWLTYYPNLTFGENQSALVNRKMEERFIYSLDRYSQTSYHVRFNNHLTSTIHNNDNHFKFQHKFFYDLFNCGIDNDIFNPPNNDSDYDVIVYINQILNSHSVGVWEDVFNDAIGAFVANRLNVSYYAFIIPNNDTANKGVRFLYEDLLLQNGKLPSGCWIAPIFLGRDLNTYNHIIAYNAKTDSNVVLDVTELKKNTFSRLANLGNGYIISIVALPLTLFFNRLTVINTTRYLFLVKEPWDIGGFSYFYRLATENTNDNHFWTSETLNILNKMIFEISEVDYNTVYNYLYEPKLMGNDFTEITVNSSTKFVVIDNYNHLNYGGIVLNTEGSFNYSLNPHLYIQNIKFNVNYFRREGKYNPYILIENGLTLQQDLQLITTGDAYETFLTQHKNAYNVSLAQGKLGVKNANYSHGSFLTKAFHGLEGGFKGLFGGSTASSGGNAGIQGGLSGFKGGWNSDNRAIKGAKLNYQATQAVTKDLKNQPRTINSANTSDTYGFLTNEKFNVKIINNPLVLNTFHYLAIYQISEQQQKNVANYYNLHGYLNEKLEVIGSNNYFLTRLYFDYFEINMISTAIDKTSGFNQQVLNWFNNAFDEGIRMWHHTKLLDEILLPQINDYRYNNWEISLMKRKISDKIYLRSG